MKIEGLPWWLSGKESTCNAGDPGLIPGSERTPGEGSGNPLAPVFLPREFHGLEEPSRLHTVHRVTKSWI